MPSVNHRRERSEWRGVASKTLMLFRLYHPSSDAVVAHEVGDTTVSAAHTAFCNPFQLRGLGRFLPLTSQLLRGLGLQTCRSRGCLRGLGFTPVDAERTRGGTGSVSELWRAPHAFLRCPFLSQPTCFSLPPSGRVLGATELVSVGRDRRSQPGLAPEVRDRTGTGCLS